MSILSSFFKAFLLGLAIAAPVGPIGMLCIRRTLQFGFVGAVAVGIGASCADSLYAAIATLGLSTVSDFFMEKSRYIRLFGGTLLLCLAFREYRKSDVIVNKKTELDRTTIKNTPIAVFFLTLTNPMTILPLIGVFSSMASEHFSLIGAIATVAGIFFGTFTWWMMLGGIIIKLQKRLPDEWLKRAKYVSIFVLLGFGCFFLYEGLKQM